MIWMIRLYIQRGLTSMLLAEVDMAPNPFPLGRGRVKMPWRLVLGMAHKIDTLHTLKITCFGVSARHYVFGPERMDHSYIALHAQRCYIQDGGKANGLKEEGLEVAATFAEKEWIVTPHFVELQRHSQKKHQQV